MKNITKVVGIFPLAFPILGQASTNTDSILSVPSFSTETTLLRYPSRGVGQSFGTATLSASSLGLIGANYDFEGTAAGVFAGQKASVSQISLMDPLFFNEQIKFLGALSLNEGMSMGGGLIIGRSSGAVEPEEGDEVTKVRSTYGATFGATLTSDASETDVAASFHFLSEAADVTDGENSKFAAGIADLEASDLIIRAEARHIIKSSETLKNYFAGQVEFLSGSYEGKPGGEGSDSQKVEQTKFGVSASGGLHGDFEIVSLAGGLGIAYLSTKRPSGEAAGGIALQEEPPEVKQDQFALGLEAAARVQVSEGWSLMGGFSKAFWKSQSTDIKDNNKNSLSVMPADGSAKLGVAYQQGGFSIDSSVDLSGHLFNGSAANWLPMTSVTYQF